MRYRPVISWSSQSWTHNIFRVWEFLFGRKVGIRAELTSYATTQGITAYYAHTFEASCALFETWVRSKFQFRPFRIVIPSLAVPSGLYLPSSPFLFAIVFDTSSKGTNSGTSLTISHTCTGSNLTITSLSESTQASNSSTSGTTYNGISMTNAVNVLSSDTSRYTAIFYASNPATGAHNIVVTGIAGTGGIAAINASYTGTTSTPAGATATGATTTTNPSSINLTTTAANSYIVDIVTINGSVALRPATASGSQVKIADQDLTAVGHSIACSYLSCTSATSYSMGWTISGGNPQHEQAALELTAFAGFTVRTLLGVGL